MPLTTKEKGGGVFTCFRDRNLKTFPEAPGMPKGDGRGEGRGRLGPRVAATPTAWVAVPAPSWEIL